MAKTKKAKRVTIPEDDNGKPDIFALTEEHEMSIIEAAEAAGIGISTAHQLFWRQEVEHNPNLKIPAKTKKDPEKLAAWVVKQRGENVRWERLVARTGLSKSELVTIYEEATGESAKRTRSEGDDKPSKKAKKSKRAKAVEEDEEEFEDEDEDEEDEDEDEDDEDEDEDEEDEEEEPVIPKKRGRRKARAK